MSGFSLQDAGGNDSNRPLKRVRTDERKFSNTTNRQYRRRSPPSRTRGGDHYKSQVHSSGARSYDSHVPNYNGRGSGQQRQRSASPVRGITTETEPQPKSKKSTRERKENPSTRIHSLRRLLSRAGLPANVQQEKERELAALIFDQQKEAIRKESRKNLKRYHFIRFVERQKAARTVKQLKKRREAGDDSEQLLKQIHEAEVDLNYTLYSPLAHKYIAIYAGEENEKTEKGRKRPPPAPQDSASLSKEDLNVLSNDQRTEIQKASVEAANQFHIGDSTKGTKPPAWYVVEAVMKKGQKALEELKNQQPHVDPKSGLVTEMGSGKKPDWLEGDGTIDAEDLDSDSDGDGGANLDVGNDDEDMSDGDGGFFEKR